MFHELSSQRLVPQPVVPDGAQAAPEKLVVRAQLVLGGSSSLLFIGPPELGMLAVTGSHEDAPGVKVDTILCPAALTASRFIAS